MEVETYSLEHLLDQVDWERFKYIEHIKTDCEGKDFDVVSFTDNQGNKHIDFEKINKIGE